MTYFSDENASIHIFLVSFCLCSRVQLKCCLFLCVYFCSFLFFDASGQIDFKEDVKLNECG